MLSLILSVVVSFAIAVSAGYLIIPVLRRLKAGQQVRDDGPKTHLVKQGTPTMGGVIIIIAVVITAIVFSRKNIQYTLFSLAVMGVFALIGFWDDFIKLFKKRSLGLRAWQKLALQCAIAVAIATFAYFIVGSRLIVPFAGFSIDLGWWYIPFTAFVVIAIVNAVNLTDGLDGLASGVTLVDTAAFTLIFMAMAGITAYDSVILNNDMFNMMVFAASVTGGCLGFLRFNKYPARVFMGDTGSFALGGSLVILGILSRLQLLLPIIGIMFVLSAVSVILQVGSYKLRHKRIFKMAPLHHHFELAGMHETRVVAMYLVITIAVSLITLLFI